MSTILLLKYFQHLEAQTLMYYYYQLIEPSYVPLSWYFCDIYALVLDQWVYVLVFSGWGHRGNYRIGAWLVHF